MTRSLHLFFPALFTVALLFSGLDAFAQGTPKKNPPKKPTPTPGTEETVPEPPAILLNDTKFKSVYVEFVSRAEKLAEEYDKGKQFDKSKACWEEILRLLPDHPKAKQMIEGYNAREAIADKKMIDILATKEWQDTGVIVLPNKPIHITANGKWTFTLSREISADGIEIPKDLRDFPLGSLVGVIKSDDVKDPKPFIIGADKSFVADKPGRLYLRMYHNNPSENKGKLSVEIQGTFEKGK